MSLKEYMNRHNGKPARLLDYDKSKLNVWHNGKHFDKVGSLGDGLVNIENWRLMLTDDVNCELIKP